MRAIREAGLFEIWVPEAYGGSAMGALALSLVTEEIAWACAATATQYLDQPLGGLPILRFDSEAQKRRYLPGLATGELLVADALSEPGAGSDAAGLKTTAVRRGDRYVLTSSSATATRGSSRSSATCATPRSCRSTRARTRSSASSSRASCSASKYRTAPPSGCRASVNSEDSPE
jgi:alkylation response protein AidB-like acyl-CoA dehydrogenase